MNNIFVTMMYGCGLPILFPIALVSLVVTYFVEIYMLFYIYRVPPAYDISLHKSKLMTMEYAGVLYFAFGFWQLSNQQLLDRNLHLNQPQMRASSEVLSHHIWSDYVFGSYSSIMDNLGPALPLYLCTVLLLMRLVVRKPINQLKAWFPILQKYLSIKGKTTVVEEGNDLYFKTIDKNHISWSYLEEKRCRELFGYSTMPLKTMENYGKNYTDS